jgi:hypothetical protein
MSSPAQDTLMGSSSVETEISAAPAAIGATADDIQLTEDDELYDFNEELEREASQRKAEHMALREKIAENAFALRTTLMSESIKGYYSSPLAMEEMSIEDMIAEIPAEYLLYLGSIKDQIFMPAEFSKGGFVPLLDRVQKALKQSQDQGVPVGGMEAAMLASIFDQSVMDLNKPISGNIADNRALWCITPRITQLINFFQWKEAEKALQED